MKKRIGALLLMLVLVMTTLVGCGGDSEGSKEGNKDGKGDVTLTMWTIATESDSFHDAV